MRRRRNLLVFASCAVIFATAFGRGNGDMVVYERSTLDGHKWVLRFSPRLELLSATDMTSAGWSQGFEGSGMRLARDSSGGMWINYAPLSDTKLLHLNSSGGVLPSIEIGLNPVNVSYSSLNSLFVMSRIGLLSPAPMQRVELNGAVTWSAFAGPNSYNFIYPRELAWTSNGALWIGGTVQGSPTVNNYAPMMKRIDSSSGHILQTFYPPAAGASLMPVQGTNFGEIAASIDGTMWCSTVVSNGAAWLYRIDGSTTLDSIPCIGDSAQYPIRVDGAADVWVVSKYNDAGAYSSIMYKLGVASGSNGNTLDAIDLGGSAIGFALGTSGCDLFATVAKAFPGTPPPYPFYLVRVNLNTKAQSRFRLDPTWDDHQSPWGDPTGFVLANVILRNTDSDGDGYANGVETAARSDPFDAKSRPNGPRVDLWFAPTTNALRLRYVDPDGLLDPVGGIDPNSLSVTASGIGEIFPLLLNFLTSVSITPDGTEATLEFDSLPIPSNVKIQLDAKVKDRSGAESWDWQVTPPGNL